MSRFGSGSETVVGVDFDNTIISYDEVMYRVARERGLIEDGVKPSKRHVRDKIRSLLDGEIAWQRVQAEVYGSRIGEARLIEGVREFFDACRRCGVRIYIVSHKTQFSYFDPTYTNLRAAATSWLARHGFFDAGLREDGVFYEPTHTEKIHRIRRLGCTHFIDDLEETFVDESFPSEVSKLLFDPHGDSAPRSDITVFVSWRELRGYFFSEHC